jgi:hypothetical protein
MKYHRLAIHEIHQILNISKEGLHESVSEEHLLENGKNELVEKKPDMVNLS